MALLKNLTRKFSTVELLNFFELIHVFVSTGMDIKEGIRCYRENLPKDSFIYKLCGQMIRDMENGSTFSDVLAKNPKTFPPYIVGMLHMAESTGKLGMVLEDIVSRLTISNDINQKISNATLVPKISFLGIIVVIVVFLVLVIPKIGDTFYEMNMDLPFITQAVLGFGSFFMDFWFLFAIAAIGGIVFYKWFQQNYPEKLARIFMGLPFWKPIALNQARYDFFIIMSLCIDAGVEPIRALEYTAMATENIYLRNIILRAVKHIKASGAAFDDALHREDTFPVMNNAIYIILEGARKTGQMNFILSRQAEHWQRNLKASTETIGDKIGMFTLAPIFILIMILAAAIILPIGQLGTNIGAGF